MPRTTMEVSQRIIRALALFEKQTLSAREVVRVGDVVYASYLARKPWHHSIGSMGRSMGHSLFEFAEFCDILLDA
jgi:hypothetical protein